MAQEVLFMSHCVKLHYVIIKATKQLWL